MANHFTKSTSLSNKVDEFVKWMNIDSTLYRY